MKFSKYVNNFPQSTIHTKVEVQGQEIPDQENRHWVPQTDHHRQLPMEHQLHLGS